MGFLSFQTRLELWNCEECHFCFIFHYLQITRCYASVLKMLNALNTHIGMATFKKSCTRPDCWGCRVSGALLHCWWGYKVVQSLWKQFVVSHEVKHRPLETAISLWGIFHDLLSRMQQWFLSFGASLWGCHVCFAVFYLLFNPPARYCTQLSVYSILFLFSSFLVISKLLIAKVS